MTTACLLEVRSIFESIGGEVEADGRSFWSKYRGKESFFLTTSHIYGLVLVISRGVKSKLPTCRSQFFDNDFLKVVDEVLNLLHSKFCPRDQVEISINLSRGVLKGAVSGNINRLKVHIRLVAHEHFGFSIISEQAGSGRDRQGMRRFSARDSVNHAKKLVHLLFNFRLIVFGTLTGIVLLAMNLEKSQVKVCSELPVVKKLLVFFKFFFKDATVNVLVVLIFACFDDLLKLSKSLSV